MVKSYNGYSAKQRERITFHIKRRDADQPRHGADSHCSICDDPERDPGSFHSEDYSEPFLLAPPATFPICRACHDRIHKRFNQPEEWILFLEHLRGGGYGREFTQRCPSRQRQEWCETIRTGGSVGVPRIRPRSLTGTEWWQTLTLDPESLHAAWARPRPLRPRPDSAAYERALAEADPTAEDLAILQFHAAQPKRSVCMRRIAEEVLSSTKIPPPQVANLRYGQLAGRLGRALGFAFDRRANGTPILMGAVAEGWQPAGREFEWVMVPSLAAALMFRSQSSGRKCGSQGGA